MSLCIQFHNTKRFFKMPLQTITYPGKTYVSVRTNECKDIRKSCKEDNNKSFRTRRETLLKKVSPFFVLLNKYDLKNRYHKRMKTFI